MDDDPGIQNQLLILSMRARVNAYIGTGFGLLTALIFNLIGWHEISAILLALFTTIVFVNTLYMIKILDRHDIKGEK